MMRQLMFLLWAIATGILAYLCLNQWSLMHSPIYKRFESQWADDVIQIETNPKVSATWKDVKDIEVIGGTPETKMMLQRVQSPLHANAKGHFRMDALVVLWEENRKTGVLIQYNIEDLKTRNTVAEISRTLILNDASGEEDAPKKPETPAAAAASGTAASSAQTVEPGSAAK